MFLVVYPAMKTAEGEGCGGPCGRGGEGTEGGREGREGDKGGRGEEGGSAQEESSNEGFRGSEGMMGLFRSGSAKSAVSCRLASRFQAVIFPFGRVRLYAG